MISVPKCYMIIFSKIAVESVVSARLDVSITQRGRGNKT